MSQSSRPPPIKSRDSYRNSVIQFQGRSLNLSFDTEYNLIFTFVCKFMRIPKRQKSLVF